MDSATTIPLDVTTVRWLVSVGAALSTLVASVMADEQNQRLKNGAFGTVAGGFAGALMALITNDDGLVVLGFVGASVGAGAGWIVSLLLSIWAAKTPLGRAVLEYQIGGWMAVRERLTLEEREPLYNAYKRWGQNFIRSVHLQKSELAKLSSGPQRDMSVEIMVMGWLLSVVEIVDLLFSIGKRPNYRSRVTIIIFGRLKDTTIKGRHWLADSGRLAAHKRGKEFDEKSIGYQVLNDEKASPFFTTGEQAKHEGQDRGEQRYRPFITFKVSNDVIAAVDWPGDLKADDPFVVATRDLFQLDLIPAIQELLAMRSSPVQNEVGLNPL